MKNTSDNLTGNLLKASLLLSDYTMAEEPEEKDALLTLIREYLDALEDFKLSLIFDKICLSDGQEKDLYIEILTDLLTKHEASFTYNYKKGLTMSMLCDEY